MGRLLGIILLTATLLGVASPFAPATAAQPDDAPTAATTLRMDVQAGFGGAGRVGGWIPLDIEIANEGPETRAEVQVLVQQAGSRSAFSSVPTTYALPLVVPRLSHRRFTMEVSLPTTSHHLTARLVRVPSGETMAEQEVPMTRIPLGDYFCGVLARDPASYDFLSALDLPPPIRRVRTAPLEPAAIPERAQLLGSFDCLILDNAATSQLRQEQLDALQVWVGSGGLLVEVGGPTWQSTLGPLPAGLLPVEITGLTSLNQLSAVGDFMETPLTDPGPWLISDARPRQDQGARVVIAQDGHPLMVASRRGEGTIIFLAFEPTSRPLRAWDGSPRLWRYLVTHAAVDSGIGSALVRPYLRWGRVPRVAMSDFSNHPQQQLNWLWGLVGGYVLALGGSLFFFGRRGQSGWALASVVGLSTVATSVAVAVAAQNAEVDVAINRIGIVRPIGAGDAAAYTREYVSVLAKRPTNVDLTLSPDALARGLYYPIPRPADESDASWALRVQEGAQPTVDSLALQQGQLASGVLDGQVRAAPGVRADLRVDQGTLQGTLVNSTGGRLEDAFLLVDTQFTPLGTLEADQSRILDLVLPDQAAAGFLPTAALTERLARVVPAGRDTTPARRDWLESLFSTRTLFSRMDVRGPALVGWLQKPATPLLVPNVRAHVEDRTLLVQPLQVVLPRGFEGEVPAAAMNRRLLGTGAGLPTEREYYTVNPGEAITLQFSLPPAEGRFDLRQLRLNVEGQLLGRSDGSGPSFTVALFNWRAAEWQTWAVGYGPSYVPDGDRYVSAAGDVRIRYILDPALSPNVRETRLTRLDVTPVGSVR